MSFSSAETRWKHLLQILSQSVHGKVLTEEELSQLTWFQKSDSIKSDPVTCARHFDHQVKKFLADILQCPQKPIGEIEDYFYKVEFQMRGSPHIHMLAWVKGSPALDSTEKGKNSLIAFVDQHISCSKDTDIDELVSLQEHKHSRTCRKKEQEGVSIQLSSTPYARDIRS